jgi:hypothetical protein
MPRVNNKDEFYKIELPSSSMVTLCEWKWVANDYESSKKFVVIELTEDLKRYDFVTSQYCEETPMLIVEEVRNDSWIEKRIKNLEIKP